MEPLLLVALIAGLYMAWNIGANDVANAMATSVGARVLTLKQAVLVAAVFELLGAIIAGGHVTKTVKSGIVDPAFFAADPHTLALGMACALIGAAIWLNIATFLRLPVSTTHAIIGALVGFGVVTQIGSIQWRVLVNVIASWFISPLTGGLIAFLLFVFIQRTVLQRRRPAEAARKMAPLLAGLVVFVWILLLTFKGIGHLLKDLGIDPDKRLVFAGAVVLAIVAAMLSRRPMEWLFRKLESRGEKDEFMQVEHVFGILQVATACLVAFAHGSNDVANAVGPLAGVLSFVREGVISSTAGTPSWILLLGGIGIVVGIMTWGYRVIRTIGNEITEITPTRGFAAEFSTAATVLGCSLLGLPVSTTHVLVGSVIGVGMARGSTLNLQTIRRVISSWVITLPASAFAAILSYFILRPFV